jgi:hypothetical protein
LSEDHDPSSQTGLTKIWGEYTVPNDDTTTPQDEGTQKLNYADNLWEDSTSPHGYSGFGTEDTDIGITLNSALSTAEWYRAELTTEAVNGGTFTITRSGGTASPSTYDITSGAYTEAATGVEFTIEDGLADYRLGDTYVFAVWPDSNDANTQKTVNVMQEADFVTVGSGETIEVKGQSSGVNETVITRGGSGTDGYDINIAGTIDAQYYQIGYLKGAGDGYGLDLQSTATVTNLADGTYDNYQNVGASDSYIRVHSGIIGVGAPTKSFGDLVFTEVSDNIPEYTITEAGGTAPSDDNYWEFLETICAGWAKCEDSDSEQNTTNGGSIRYATIDEPLDPGNNSENYSLLGFNLRGFGGITDAGANESDLLVAGAPHSDDTRLTGTDYAHGTNEGYIWMANEPLIQCFETTTNAGSTNCEDTDVTSGGMIAVCGGTGCYDRARVEIEPQDNPSLLYSDNNRC